ncbi:MAG TPA: fimbria/pilus outer membrane usher protein [Rhodopseudomonas sp.]|uniref:fimbria/pilus outer membrane usher protein n=1 Tax=Rhodopseudomonas sp. TaxID=1078 RepID=UPI002EDA17B0
MMICAWPALANAQAAPADLPLYLEVYINGQPTGLIANFVQRPKERLAIKTTELEELRIRSERFPIESDGTVYLDRCPDLSYRYDQARQVVRIEITDQGRLPFMVETKPRSEAAPVGEQASGAVMNYTLVANSDGGQDGFYSALQNRPALSAGIDARIFNSYGVFSQSGILNSGSQGGVSSLRLDSTWSYSDPFSLTTYRAGDVISGALSWSRSLRLGGAQIQRNFGLRPDLVTMPMPRFSGSAALPSTVDIFVNSIRSYSGEIPAGPFQIQNLPIMSGAGNQRIVVQDSLGRQTVIDQPFYASSKLLAPGLFDFSAEAGFTRRDFGVVSNSYDSSPAASASLRYGLNDWLTLETHAEAAETLLNGGAGVNVLLGRWGVASLALAASRGDGNITGGLLSASLELGRGGYTVYARTQRASADYRDLAALPPTNSAVPGVSLLARRPPRDIDQLALSIPLGFDPSAVTLSMTRMQDALDNRYQILGLSYSRPLGDASLFVSAFKDFDDRRSYGIFCGLTMSFNGGITATASGSKTGGGGNGGFEINKSQSLEPGSWGWRGRDFEGASPSRAGAVSYRSEYGRAEVGVQQFGHVTQATAQFDGAVAYVGGSTFLANRIDDAFVVVDAGAPNVDVFYENRPVATTGASGLVLVPYLRAYQKNWISIDAKNLPVDADIPTTKAAVVPADRGAALVKFGISEDSRSAVVVLKGRDGRAMPAGSSARLKPEDEATVVGYGGEVYLRGLNEANQLVVERPEGETCTANFDYHLTPGQRVVIKDVVCQ